MYDKNSIEILLYLQWLFIEYKFLSTFSHF